MPTPTMTKKYIGSTATDAAHAMAMRQQPPLDEVWLSFFIFHVAERQC